MDEQRLTELEKLANEATPGEWNTERVYPDKPWYRLYDADGSTLLTMGTLTGGYVKREADAAFIAVARTAVPELITALREAQEIKDDLHQLIDALEQCPAIAPQVVEGFRSYLLKNTPTMVCTHCGLIIDNDSPDANTTMMQHIQVCEKNPVVQRAEHAEAEAAKYRKEYESVDEVLQALTVEMLRAGMSAVEGNEFHWHNKRAEKAEQEVAKLRDFFKKHTEPPTEEKWAYVINLNNECGIGRYNPETGNWSIATLFGHGWGSVECWYELPDSSALKDA